MKLILITNYFDGCDNWTNYYPVEYSSKEEFQIFLFLEGEKQITILPRFADLKIGNELFDRNRLFEIDNKTNKILRLDAQVKTWEEWMEDDGLIIG